MVRQARGFGAEAPLRAAEAGREVTWSFSSYFSMTSGTSLDMVASPSGHQGRRVCDPFFSTTLLNGSNSLIERRNSIRRRRAAAHHRRFSGAHRNPSFHDGLEALETSSKVVVPQVFCREDVLLRRDTCHARYCSNHTAAGWRGSGPPPSRPPVSPTTGSLSRWPPRGTSAEAAAPRLCCLMAAPLRRGAPWRPLMQGAGLFWPRLVA